MIVSVQKPDGFVMVCDFCAIDEKRAKTLIASPNGTHICDACVSICVDVLARRENLCAECDCEHGGEDCTWIKAEEALS